MQDLFPLGIQPSLIGGALLGIGVGLVTGLALVLLLRGTPIPQVKEEVQAS